MHVHPKHGVRMPAYLYACVHACVSVCLYVLVCISHEPTSHTLQLRKLTPDRIYSLSVSPCTSALTVAAGACEERVG